MEQRIIDRQLTTLREKFFALGELTQKAFEGALKSLTTRDSELARRVIAEDEAIDNIELEIDRLIIEIFVLQQPAAHDLRLVIAVSKITPILERIADHAGNIAKSVLRIEDEPELQEFPELPLMADNAAEMLRIALEAFLSEDAETSRRIINQDKIIDSNYKRFFGQIIGTIITNPASINSSAQLLFVAKHLERIGDYVKDICELTVYLTEAVFIKHSVKSD